MDRVTREVAFYDSVDRKTILGNIYQGGVKRKSQSVRQVGTDFNAATR
ncbi:hypothetical protein QPK87_24255 [Kamptonema cortianum]|nr:hypothetical protein [Kamptonema cortianum]